MKMPIKFIRKHLDIYFMLVASFMFALSGVFAKILATNLPSVEVMFFRNVIATIIVVYQLSKIEHKKQGGKFILLLIRSLAAVASLYLFFYNVAQISLGGAFAFLKTNAIFIVIISMIVLKEKLNFIGICGILISFVGVLFVIDPFSFSGFNLKNSFFGIMGGLLSAISITSMRQLGHSYNTEYILLGFFGAGVVLPCFSMLFAELYPNLCKYEFLFANFITPNGFMWIWIFLMGYTSLIYQSYYTKAYRVTKKAGIVAGISYSDVAFTLFFGLLLGDAIPSLIVFFGISLIVAGGIIVSTIKF